MSEAVVHVESGAVREADKAPRGRTRTCVGCGVRHVAAARGPTPRRPAAATAGTVDAHPDCADDLVRLVLGPEGEIAVDARGGAFGRGAHVHARPVCLERAVKGGLARSTKGKALAVLGADGTRHPLQTGSLARAIQEAMDRRIEGLFAAAVRSRQLTFGADAVTGALQRQEAELIVVARDAAEAAELNEVRRAVAEGRAVAWGDKPCLGRMVTLGKTRAADQDAASVAVVAILSRPIAEALQQAVRIADACAGTAATSVSPKRGGGGTRGHTRGPVGSRDRQGAGSRGGRRETKDDRSDG
jgi:predicted RNA-binding protein YlxR (DUF448 family)/ribosomal protein L7Ae-like RNA K-turn-binding protein